MSLSLTHRHVSVGFVYVARPQSLVILWSDFYESLEGLVSFHTVHKLTDTHPPAALRSGSPPLITCSQNPAEVMAGSTLETPVTTSEMDHSCTEYRISIRTCKRGKLTHTNNEKSK